MDSNLLNKYKSIATKASKSRATERGELLEYIVSTINSERLGTRFKPVTIKRIGALLTGVPTGDLYFVQKEMQACKKRGYSPSKWFFGRIKKHEEERRS